jgi:aspartyl aminopeptidase
MPEEDRDRVKPLLEFIAAAPTPYHAVQQATQRLNAAGFVPLHEHEAWSLRPGARVYVTRGGSSVAAFILGERPPHEAGFALIGSHTDSPNLRVKPRPDVSAHGYRQVAVEPYGGLLLTTWLDRDLSLAGRVVVDDGSASGRTHLVDLQRPVLRIPNLAIHLNRTVNTEGLKLNAQNHMVPVLGLERDDDVEPALLSAIAAELGAQGVACEPAQLVGFDLCLYDVQPPAIGGLHDEFIFSARLDNLASCHAALQALAGASVARPETRGIVLYDHEEVGSQSAQGAASPFLRDVLARLVEATAPGEPTALSRAVARSLLISADMAHAVHPNYAEKHEPGHRPVLGGGPVLKTNFGQSYASDAETSARFLLLCRKAGVPLQQFVTRSDQGCGSTIGPITAGRTGMRTVDVGSPLLSMHSVREMASTADVTAMQKVLDAFFAGHAS